VLIKFTKHGTGSVARAVNYLLASHDHKGVERESVEVLDGGIPDLVILSGDSIERKHKYSSAVISWAPGDDPTREQEQAVLDDFIKVAAAGRPDPEGLTYLAVRHVASPPHIHVVMIREDAISGTAYNPAPPGWEKHFGVIEDLHNARNGWADPGDPARARAVAGTRGRRNNDKVRSKIEEDIYARAQRGELPDREALRAACEEHGEVTRMGKGYVSIKVEGADKAMRFKTSIFGADNPNEAAVLAAQEPPVRPPNVGNEVEAALRLNEVLKARRQWWDKKKEQSDDRPHIDGGQDSRVAVAAGGASADPAGATRSARRADSGDLQPAHEVGREVDRLGVTLRAAAARAGRGSLWARARRSIGQHFGHARKAGSQGQPSRSVLRKVGAAIRRIGQYVRPVAYTQPAAVNPNDPLYQEPTAAPPPVPGHKPPKPPGR
jgi:hypothetical protein